MATDLLYSALISIALVIVTITIFYEILRAVWRVLPDLKRTPYLLMNLVILATFAGHTLCVWLYGGVFWVLDHYYNFGGLGAIGDNYDDSFLGYVYFSAATYSSLGFGDVYPTGPLRMIAGVEVINGLLLIGWSVTFTFLVMQKFWDLHPKRKQK